MWVSLFQFLSICGKNITVTTYNTCGIKIAGITMYSIDFLKVLKKLKNHVSTKVNFVSKKKKRVF